MTLYSNFRKI